jgi:small subunit ribosomal protein S20
LARLISISAGAPIAGVDDTRASVLANIKSAAKKARQSEKHRQHNAALRTRMRSAIKKTDKSVKSGDATAATAALTAAVPEIDAMVSKGIVHRNKAARHKSRLNKAVKALKSK